MPKQYHTIRDWSGGSNNRRDPRDIGENECAFIINMSVDALGKIKTAGGLFANIEGSDGTTNLSEYPVNRTASILGSGGYGLFYFESDHSGVSEQTIIYTVGTTFISLGTSNGNISFVRRKTTVDTPADIPDAGG